MTLYILRHLLDVFVVMAIAITIATAIAKAPSSYRADEKTTAKTSFHIASVH